MNAELLLASRRHRRRNPLLSSTRPTRSIAVVHEPHPQYRPNNLMLNLIISHYTFAATRREADKQVSKQARQGATGANLWAQVLRALCWLRY
jgi:hypothetical protein